jgi:AMP phosphorylase
VRLKAEGFEAVAILNIAGEFPSGVLGVYREVASKLGLSEGGVVEVEPAERPESLSFVRKKIIGEKLTPGEMEMIVEDVVERHLSDVEMAAFVTALEIHGLSMEEAEALSLAMVKTGWTLNFGEGPILDKHSIGGVPGDKTTLLVVPIVAAAGYRIPKTSSRAITSPAGTADRMEALAPVALKADEIVEVMERVGGCIVWGGALDLAPADDLFIRVEYPLSIDPLLLPSIMSKKKAVGSTHVVIDIPTGRGAKVKTIGQANALAMDFIELGGRLGIEVECAITEGEQPIGHAIGPILEAREALETLKGRGPSDLMDKATTLAGILLEMVGESGGKRMAEELLGSRRAERKMREIIEAQGGDPEVEPEDLEPGRRWAELEAEEDGRVLWINNHHIAQIARAAGAPSDKGAGILLRVKMGDEIKRGDSLMMIYAESSKRLEEAVEMAEELRPIGVGERRGEKMLIAQIRGLKPHRRRFILER